MKNAGKARSYGLYRHLRTSKEIIENLLNYLNLNVIINLLCLIAMPNTSAACVLLSAAAELLTK